MLWTLRTMYVFIVHTLVYWVCVIPGINVVCNFFCSDVNIILAHSDCIDQLVLTISTVPQLLISD